MTTYPYKDNNKFVEVMGDLYNTDMCVMRVTAVKYQRHSDQYQFNVEYTNTRFGDIRKSFATETEAKAYRDEFINKVCN